MPRTPVTVTTLSTRDGLAPPAEVAGDVANGNVLLNNNGVNSWIEVTNTTGGSLNITFGVNNSVDGVAAGSKVVAMATTVKRRFGPFPVNVYGTEVAINVTNAGMTIMGYQISP